MAGDPVSDGMHAWLRAFSDEVPLALNAACVTCTRPEDDPEVIAFTDHWKVVLHPDQTVLGACLIGSRRHVPKVSALTPVEAADFFALFALVETALERVVQADLVNLSCLRNWAYREVDPEPPFLDGRPNPHVHWHVAPRYRRPVTFGSQEFTDIDFGEELTWTGRRLEPSSRRELIEAIRGPLPITFEPSTHR